MIRLQFSELKQISRRKSTQGLKLFFICFLTLFTVNYNSFAQDSKKFRVVIDAGHGGEDFGVHKLGLKEKDVTLKVALKMEEYFAEDSDVELIYTRTKDEICWTKRTIENC